MTTARTLHNILGRSFRFFALRTPRLGALLIAASCTLACGGSGSGGDFVGNEGADGGQAAFDSSAPIESGVDQQGQAGAASVNCDDRPTETVELNQTIWQTGFKVTLGTVTFQPATRSCSPGLLDISAQFENRGDETTEFEARTLLSSAGKDYELPYGQDIPEVPGERMGNGSFHFEVDDTFSLDDARISFGAAARHQATVPLSGQSPEALITLEPQDLPFEGKISAGNLALEFVHSRVLADSSITHSSMAEDEVRLVLEFKAQVTANLTKSAYVSDDAFILRLPDGTSVAADRAANEGLMQKGVSVDMWVEFVIPFPSLGDYVLEAREMNLGFSNPLATAELPFTLPSFPSFGEK